MRIKEGIFTSVVYDIIFDKNLCLRFTYNNRSHRYSISSGISWLNHHGSDNSIILRRVYGKNYVKNVEELYGHKTNGCWPVWRKTDEIIRLLLDMESKGVIITIL